MNSLPRPRPRPSELSDPLRDAPLTHSVVNLRHEAGEGALHVGRVKRGRLQETFNIL